MDDDPSLPSLLGTQLDEIKERLRSLESLVANQTRQIRALEERAAPRRGPASVETPGRDAGANAAPRSNGVSELSPIISNPLPALTPLLHLFPSARRANSQGTASAGAPEKSSLEALIGGRWLLWVGIVATVLATVYFLKLALENNWAGAFGRVAIDLLIGGAFLAWGEALQKHKYPYFGQIVTGGGGAILFVSAYALFTDPHAFPVSALFTFLLAVTAVLFLLAARYSSLAVAFIGLAGGFLVPFWLRGNENHQVALLGYATLLIVGIAGLAQRRGWTILNYFGSVLTFILFADWVHRFYANDRRGSTEFFLCLMAGLFFYIGKEALQTAQGAARPVLQYWMGATLVLLFASSSANLFRRGMELLTFILIFDALMVALALRVKSGKIVLGAFWVSAAGVLMWFNWKYTAEQLLATAVLVSALFALFFSWPLLARLFRKMVVGGVDLAVMALNALAMFGAVFFLLHESHRHLAGVLAVLLAFLYFGLAEAVKIRLREERRFFAMALGIGIAVLTLAVPLELQQNWITLFWAAEAVILTGIGMRASRPWMVSSAWAVLGLTVFRLLVFDAQRAEASFLLLFNRRFLTYVGVIAACYLIAWMPRRSSERVAGSAAIGVRVIIVLASFLSVVAMTQETSSYYSAQRVHLSEALQMAGTRVYNINEIFRPIDSAKQVAYSVIWGVYSIVLIVVGIVKRCRDIRLFAMALFALTIAKVFVVISSLGMIYRVLSMTVLGAMLLLAAYLYQHYRKVIL